MPRNIEDCAWKFSVSNVAIIPGENLELEKPTWTSIPTPVRFKLVNAVRMAPVMVEDALVLLNEHVAKVGLEKDGSIGPAQLTFSTVGKALRKYFHLVP